MRKKQFETWELRRIPVTLSPLAQSVINASSIQGKLFPQALSELFGAKTDVREVQLDIVPHTDHFPDGVASTKDMQLCRVTVVHQSGINMMLLEAANLSNLHTSGHPAFVAVDAARELVRMDENTWYD